MGLDYDYPTDGSKACSREPLKVKLDGRHVGEIRKHKDGYQYFAKDAKQGGSVFPTVPEVQESLRSDRPAKSDREPAVTEVTESANEKLHDEIKALKETAKANDANMERAKTLLTATFDLLGLQQDSKETLNLLEENVQYDDADCDGHSLSEDIRELIDSME